MNIKCPVRGAALLAALALQPGAVAAAQATPDEDRIRSIVEQMLKQKDKQMNQLEQRVRELEQLTKDQKTEIDQLRAAKPAPAQAAAPAAPSKPAAQAAAKPATSPLSKLILPAKKAEAEEEESGPKVGGFFDVTAQTKTGNQQTFNLGVVELDLDRIVESEHFAASAALDWFPYGTDPQVQIGVAFVDFHMYDDSVPVRGRIFQEPGFHLQAGTFDLPFSSDYQFFASKDRLTITPPVTTQRIQGSGINPSNGGFNSTGVRTYGNWNNISYALYWTDSVYDDGTSIGGRIGGFMNNPYRVHRRSDLPIVDGGLSVLFDLDTHEQTRNQVYSADLSFNYGPFRLLNEVLWRNSLQPQVASNGVDYGKPSEVGYHVTLIANLQKWLEHDLYAYTRFQQWFPHYDYVVDGDGNAYKVRPIPQLSLGFGYRLNTYLTMKFEYTDSFDQKTAEPDFQTRLGMAQLVATF